MSKTPFLTMMAVLLGTVPTALAQTDSLPEGKGKEIVAAACVQCHKLEMVTTHNYNIDDWKIELNAMVFRGLKLTPEDYTTVAEYLAKNFPELPPEPTPVSTPAPKAKKH
jgi:hypothetical protein